MKRRNRRWLLSLLCLLMLTVLTGAAADTLYTVTGGDGTLPVSYNQTTVAVPTPTAVPQCSHNWQFVSYRVEPNCTAGGTAYYKCANCGEEKTANAAALGHNYASWTTVTEATCQAEGKERAVCTRCGDEKTRTVPKKEHQYGSWSVTKEPTCKEQGKKVAKCRVCGTTKSLRIEKADHSFSEWEIITEATDHSKGTRKHTCSVCGKSAKEDYYPEGTLRRKGENPAGEVKELQEQLKELGFFDGKADDDFGSATEKAVKRFQKSAGLKSDGIAWPETRAMLRKKTMPGEPMTEDVDKFTLQLAVEIVSEKKEAYQVDDVITFEWTVTNAGKKDASGVAVTCLAGESKAKKSLPKIGSVEKLAAGDAASGTWEYTVTKKDVITGSIKLTFGGSGTVQKKKLSTNAVMFKLLTGEGGGIGGGWEPPDTSVQLKITKTVDNKPANKLHFVKGEKVVFKIVVENKGKTAIKDLVVTDPMDPKLKGNIGTLKGGKKKEFTVEYIITDVDVGMGGVTNTVTASYLDADSKLVSSTASAFAPAGQKADTLMISKKVVNTPANGKFFVPGETVKFEITLTNPTKKDFVDITVFDVLCKTKGHILQLVPSLKAGKNTTLVFEHKVTESQAKNGWFDNIVSATFRVSGKSPLRSVSNSCRVMTGFEGQDGIMIVKSVIDAPANGEYYQLDEEIRYLIEITNHTMVDYTVDVRDILAPLDIHGHRTIAEKQALASGATISLHFSYVVTEADVEATSVTNQASVVRRVTKLFTVETPSNEVTVPTARVMKARVPKKPELAPGACQSILTGRGDGIAEYELDECDTHTPTAKAAGTLIANGDYEAATQLWREDMDVLYQEWIDCEDPAGKRLVENDQAAMDAQLEAWEASMVLLYPDAPEAVDALVTEAIMNECVGLCYELHTAPEKRTDAISAITSGMNAADESELCQTDADYDENGTAHFVECQCETHILVAEVTDELLAAAENDEERSHVWERAQALWVVELDSLYDDWYLAADEADRETIAADRLAFGEAMLARQQVLNELYPDDPAVANEVLARMIMKRTQYVCQALHQAGILEE